MIRNWAVFISGRGSNLAALLELPSQFFISLVVSSHQDCPGVGKARRSGVPIKYFSKKDDWQELTTELRLRGVQGIFLAGFMRILPVSFVESWQGKILNVHPSLLPSYPGLRSMERAFAEGKDMGVSIHQVDGGVDTGQLVRQKLVWEQKEVKAADGDVNRFVEFEFLMHRMEHRLIQEVVPCL